MSQIKPPPPKDSLPPIFKEPSPLETQTEPKTEPNPVSKEIFEQENQKPNKDSLPLVLIPSHEPVSQKDSTFQKSPTKMEESELVGFLESFLAEVSDSENTPPNLLEAETRSALFEKMISELKIIAKDFRSYVDNPTENFQQPYESKIHANIVEGLLRKFFLPAAQLRLGKEDASIWRAFLDRQPGDSLDPIIFDDPSSRLVKNFRKATDAGCEYTLETLAAALPYVDDGCFPANKWVDVSWEDMQHQCTYQRWATKVAYMNTFEFCQARGPSGNLAGGVGSSAAGPDERHVSGTCRWRINTDQNGEIRSLDVEMQLNFLVRDSVDFSPGSPGCGRERYLTVPLSRLEASNMAFAVPFEVHFEGSTISRTFSKKDLDKILRGTNITVKNE